MGSYKLSMLWPSGGVWQLLCFKISITENEMFQWIIYFHLDSSNWKMNIRKIVLKYLCWDPKLCALGRDALLAEHQPSFVDKCNKEKMFHLLLQNLEPEKIATSRSQAFACKKAVTVLEAVGGIYLLWSIGSWLLLAIGCWIRLASGLMQCGKFNVKGISWCLCDTLDI